MIPPAPGDVAVSESATHTFVARINNAIVEAGLRLPPLSRTLSAPPVERKPDESRRERIVALTYGAACHGL